MPNRQPPKTPPAEPRLVTLAAGTRLSRVHSAQFGAAQFNPTLADPHWGGARFDATEADRYGYLYAGSDSACAVAETLLSDLPEAPGGGRFLPRSKIARRKISRLILSADVPLVSLCDGGELGRLGQDDNWLASCTSAEYPFTRRWGHALRAWVSEAQGFVWPSRRDAAKRAYVLFEDRFTAALTLDPDERAEDTEALPPVPGQLALDTPDGERYLLSILAHYSVTLPPRS
jgi:hypothetical protein